MKDTSGEIEREFRARIMSLSPATRLAIACRMFTTAKKLATAGIMDKSGHLEEHELRRALFLRFYGGDFTREEKEAILERL